MSVSTVTIISRDELGIIARDASLAEFGLPELYYLTACCEAAVTGVSVTPANPEGVACKGCYRPVNPALAGEPVL